jgi:hypothetical protein
MTPNPKLLVAVLSLVAAAGARAEMAPTPAADCQPAAAAVQGTPGQGPVAVEPATAQERADGPGAGAPQPARQDEREAEELQRIWTSP